MLVEFEHHPHGDGVLVKGGGTVAASDFSRIQEIIYAEHRLPSLRYILVDLSDVRHFDATLDELRALAETDVSAARARNGLLIAVVGEEDIVFGLARVWSAYADTPGLETKVCRSLSDAKAWIAGKLSGEG